jgi:hypothetical protein
MMRLVVGLGALVLYCCGCSAPTACEDEPGSQSATTFTVSSPSVPGSSRLSNAGEAARLNLVATVTGLPELWQADSAILQGNGTIFVSLAYEGEPRGGDGRTEMPRVRVTFPDSSAGFGSSETPAFPTAAGSTFSTRLFDACPSGDKSCCPFGERECSVPFAVLVERIEGEPFPPIVVAWRASADAEVTTCPLRQGDPALSLRLEGP